MARTERSIVSIRRVGMYHCDDAVIRVTLAMSSQACSGDPCFQVNQRRNTHCSRRAPAMSKHIDAAQHATTNEPELSIDLSFR